MSTPELQLKANTPAGGAASVSGCVQAAVRLQQANAQEAETGAALSAEKAELAAVEAELAALPHPGVDDAAIEAHLGRVKHLEIKQQGYRDRILGAEDAQRAAAAETVAAREAIARARTSLFEPPAYTPADLSRLSAEAQKLRQKATAARAELERTEREAAPALAAFDAVCSTDDGADEARRALADYLEARERIEAARTALAEREASVGGVERIVERLTESLDRERRLRVLRDGARRLESWSPGLTTAAQAFDKAGEELARLIRTWVLYVDAHQRHIDFHNRYGTGERRAALFTAPHFYESAFVPGAARDGVAFVSNQHHFDSYSRFEPRGDILTRLREQLRPRDADERALFKQAAEQFEAEYIRLAKLLLQSLAPFALWVGERQKLLTDAGDVAAGEPLPPYPLVTGTGIDILPWRRLDLPSLRRGAEPLWASHWPLSRVLEQTAAEAA